jgi:hypothetical protein
MSKPSPKPQSESSRQYTRLLKGQTSAKTYVTTLKKEARTRVQSQRSGKRAAK